MWNKFKNSLPANIFFLILTIGVGYGSYNMVVQTLSLWKESDSTRKKIEELTKKKEELERYTAELETKEGAERAAKKHLNLKLPGEGVVVVVPERREISVQRDTLMTKIQSFFAALFWRRR